MVVFSKIKDLLLNQIMKNYKKYPNSHKISIIFIIIQLLVALNKLKKKPDQNDLIAQKVMKQIQPQKKNKGRVDKQFFKKLWILIKIVIPNFKCKEFLDIMLLSVSLYLRTLLSIYLAEVKGKLVKGIIEQNFSMFLKGILQLGICSVPGSFINSSLTFLNKRLSLNFRERMTNYFLSQYLENLVYYKITNLDQRIVNPDQNLTADLDKWCNSLSTLYSNISKPLLDIILISKNLSETLGWTAPAFVILWYMGSGVLQWMVSPVIGKMTAVLQKLEGQYRYVQSEFIKHSEQIAFYNGQEWEKKNILDFYNKYTTQENIINYSRLYMGTIDSILIKYGANVLGYFLIGIPVFGGKSQEYLENIKDDKAKITRDYVKNSSLLIDLAGAIGRLIASYKNIQMLAGYTTLVFELKETVEDVTKAKFVRTQIEGSKRQIQGQVQESDIIKFENVPIISPNGEVLVDSLNFQINSGMNVLISGPNGCGKSSMFRILGNLWPLYGGTIHKPQINKMFYIPQRPYLPYGTLRDQIIYPHSKQIMLNNGVDDDFIKNLLNEVQIHYLLDKDQGLDAIKYWNDELSQGEKQKLAMARLFYHKPDYAILDECTSNTSLDMETLLYNKCKQLNITLFTVSHRQSLFKFHEFVLKFDGEGNYNFYQMIDNKP